MRKWFRLLNHLCHLHGTEIAVLKTTEVQLYLSHIYIHISNKKNILENDEGIYLLLTIQRDSQVPTCYRVNSKSDIDSFFLEELHHFSDGVLGFGDTESVAWGDDDVPCLSDHLYSRWDINLGVGSCDLHGFTSTSGLCSVTSQNYIG